MAIFVPKPWVNPFGKIPIFQHFYSLPKRFSSLQYHQIHFARLFLLKKKCKILNFFYQNHGKTSLEKSQIFDFFKSLFLYSKQGFFFFLEYHQAHFPGLFCLKLKRGKISILGDHIGPTVLG